MKVELLSFDAINSQLSDYWRVSVLDETTSTMQAIKSDEITNWELVAAEFQSAGRGRLDRKFDSEKSTGLLFSVFYTPKIKNDLGFISLIAGQTLVEVLRDLTEDKKYKTKWPNDILHGDNKIAGLLIEYFNDGLIIGIGINVSNKEDQLPVSTANSIYLSSNKIIDRNLLLAKICNQLRRNLNLWEQGIDFRQTYRETSATLGQRVSAKLPGGEELSGIATDIGSDGTLFVDGAAISVGDIVHLQALK